MYVILGLIHIALGIAVLIFAVDFLRDEFKEWKNFWFRLGTLLHYDVMSMFTLGTLLIIVGTLFIFGINIYK